jgi:hypothetical protein
MDSHCHDDVNSFLLLNSNANEIIFYREVSHAGLKMSRTFLPRVGPCLLSIGRGFLKAL